MGKVLCVFLLMTLTACAASPDAVITPATSPTPSATIASAPERPLLGKLTLVEFFAVT